MDERHDTPDWDRIEAIFGAAVERPTAERAAFLDRACAGEPELRAEVDSLLAAHDRAATFLADPALESLETDVARHSLEGRLVGPWHVLRLLGRGGMGAVYLAERADGEYERRVALKVIKRGMDTDAVLARFLRERQILAGLDHPGIARFVDAGATDDGRPYFVMERIRGRSLMRYCDDQGLGLDARLRLFCEVCRAVQYAHGNLVVHRDLKPSNILVTAEGGVKLLDFGIAKVLAGDPRAGAGTLTDAAPRPATPEYAAPEQLQGAPVTTATDVYSLGAVLYELVTGRTPHRLDRRSPDEALRAVATGEPIPPSRAVEEGSPAGSGSGVRRRARHLRGDLDTIILTALHPEPGRRYPTAQALLDDLGRHLNGRPVAARPDTAFYRMSRFIYRHRVGVGVAAVVAITLVGSSVALSVEQGRTARERDRAELEAAKARQVADFLTGIFEVSDPSVSRGEDITARALLDDGAARLEIELANQPELHAEMAAVVGDVYRRLGEYEAAVRLFRSSVELTTALEGPFAPATGGALGRLGRAHRERGELEAADSVLGRALAILELAPPEYRLEHARVLDDLGTLRWRQADLEAADSLMRKALALKGASEGGDGIEVAASLVNLGMVARARDDFEAAEAHHRGALAIYTAELGEDDRRTAEGRKHLALVLHQIGRLDEAEALYRATLAVEDRIYGGWHSALGRTLNSLASLLRDQGRFEESEALYVRAIGMYRELLGPDHPQIATALTNLGALLRQTGRLERALEADEEALAMRRRLFGSEHPAVATALNNRALVLRELGRLEGARGDFLEVVRIYDRQLGPRHFWMAFALMNLGSVHLLAGDPATADSLYRQAEGIQDEHLTPDHPDRAIPLLGRGEAALLSGRPAEARPLLEEALRLREAALEPTHWRIAEARSLLGDCLSRLGELDRGEPLLIAGLAGLTQALGESSIHTRRARERLDRHRDRRPDVP